LGPLRLTGGNGGEYDGVDREGDELEIDLRSLDTVARWVAGYGPDVVVRHPSELAQAVRRSWAAVAAAHSETENSAAHDQEVRR
jgi:proteasome accessory factor B